VPEAPAPARDIRDVTAAGPEGNAGRIDADLRRRTA
jgi:hypothetical protein